MARRKAQMEFEGAEFHRPRDWFGGSAMRSHAKTKRPLDSKLPVHVVLRSKKARGDSSFQHPRHFDKVNRTVRNVAGKYGIKIHEFANVGNHLHLVVRVKVRRLWGPFIRELTGRVAQLVLGLRGRAAGLGPFWDYRPFTRVVRGWGRAYRVIKDYVLLNRLEGDGLLTRWDIHKASRPARSG